MTEPDAVWTPKANVSDREIDVGGVKRHAVPVAQNEKAEPIPLAHNTMWKMTKGGAEGIRLAAMLAGQDERKYLPTVKTGLAADAVLASREPQYAPPQRMPRDMFARGDSVYDTKTGKRAVIVATNVGYTQRGTPLHKLASKKTGAEWLQRETKLQKL